MCLVAFLNVVLVLLYNIHSTVVPHTLHCLFSRRFLKKRNQLERLLFVVHVDRFVLKIISFLLYVYILYLRYSIFVSSLAT